MYKNSELPTLDWVFSVKIFGYVRYFPKIFGVPRNLDSKIELKSVLVFNINVDSIDTLIGC